ncbi:MAG: UvrB/UvrC motif-containing protein [Phycisphaerales bacterium]|nr:UvrB/UvrC motif-containing protein [Phycisphaerales bacterium]
MKCDKCANEATVHEVVIKGGKQHEKHLCEQCAKGDGLPVQTHAPLTSLLTQYITQQTDAAATIATGVAPASAQATCPACGLGFAQFRQSGLLGCAVCYEAFEQQLGPLLARAHEGGTHHVGKSPKSAERVPGVKTSAVAPGGEGASASQPASVRAANPSEIEARNNQLAALRKQLSEAVAAEQYEKAAKIRDELARLDSGTGPAVRDTAPKRPRKKDKEGDA